MRLIEAGRTVQKCVVSPLVSLKLPKGAPVRKKLYSRRFSARQNASISSLAGIEIPVYEALRAERPVDADTSAQKSPSSIETHLL